MICLIHRNMVEVQPAASHRPAQMWAVVAKITPNRLFYLFLRRNQKQFALHATKQDRGAQEEND